MSRMRGIGVVVLVAVVAAIGWFAWSSRSKGRTSTEAAAIPVAISTATHRPQAIWLSAIGTVLPLQVVNVKARIDGELQKVLFTEGQNVRSGQVLAQIDPRPYEAQLNQAQAALLKDEAQVANTRNELARYSSLANIGAAPTQNVDTLKSQAATLEASMAADRALIDTARLQVGFTTLTSPIDGRAGFRQVDRGSMIRASDANGIVTVTQVRPIAVVFGVSQDVLPDLVAERAKRELKVEVLTRDARHLIATGELASLDNQVDTATGQLKLKALFKNDDEALWPGALVSIRILLRTDSDVLVVPAQAVQSGLHGDYVYVVRADQTVEPRPVKTGATVDGFIALGAGVADGERVVVEGQSRLEPGSRVVDRSATTDPQVAVKP